jgi:GcrA cell cycle regulator
MRRAIIGRSACARRREAIMLWTDETIELLRALWRDGKSASQIAAMLGGGATRNAVIGKFHRLGLTGRVKIKAPAAPRVRQKASRPRRARVANHAGDPLFHGNAALALGFEPAIEPEPCDAVVAPISLCVTLVELNEAMCRWPLGDPMESEFRYCGLAANSDGSYCRRHMQLAYRPRSQWRRERWRSRPISVFEAC